jgi:hypothetical protein
MRPRSIAEISQRAKAAPKAFDPAAREFLDSWQMMSRAERETALACEPDRIGSVEDAYLAALAEHLALDARLPVPSWTEEACRFLSEPFFAGGLETLKALLIVESPLAFRRRLIFISADALSRPARQAVATEA